jgi:hypothetical protein
MEDMVNVHNSCLEYNVKAGTSIDVQSGKTTVIWPTVCPNNPLLVDTGKSSACFPFVCMTHPMMKPLQTSTYCDLWFIGKETQKPETRKATDNGRLGLDQNITSMVLMVMEAIGCLRYPLLSEYRGVPGT